MLSLNPKVVIVDDQYEEVAPLTKALWKKGIPFIYLDGAYNNLPKKPFVGVRFLFLDIELGTQGNSDENMASALAGRVKSLIGEKSSPYFIVFWTKNNSQISQVLKYLKVDGIAPIGYVDFDKPIRWDKDAVTEDDLIKKIDKKMNSLGAFQYILDWENVVESAVSDFSSDFLSLVQTDGDIGSWSATTANLLGNLSCACTGSEQLSESFSDNIKNSMIMLSRSYMDNLQKHIKSKEFDDRCPLSATPLSLTQRAKLNSKLFFDFRPPEIPTLGSLFIQENQDSNYWKTLAKSIFKKEENAPQGTSLCGIIITPACDLAWGNNLHSDENHTINYRILYGLLIPVNEENNKEKPRINKKESFFCTEAFWYEKENKPYKIVFHFSGLTSEWWGEKDIPPFDLIIQEQLVFDIQSKLANHANRLGNNMLILRKSKDT